MLESKKIKINLLCWLRFDKQVPLVATEAGHWNADVMGISEKEAVEYEIKVSKTDLKQEFETKRDKHFIYREATNTKWIPHRFFFVVPPELADDAVALCREHAPRYGVYTFTPRAAKKKKKHVKGMSPFTLVKKASRLHDEPTSPELMDRVLSRASSELCRTYMELEKLSDLVDTLKKEKNDESSKPKDD